jgi:ribosome biogenesis protein NSA1
MQRLPEPLQCCEFEPKSDPRFFAYGGEDVPLSVNDISHFFSSTEENHEDDHDVDEVKGNGVGDQDEQENGLGASEEADSSTSKKRRRAAERKAKAKELMKGEIWRAKNVSMSTSFHPATILSCLAS